MKNMNTVLLQISKNYGVRSLVNSANLISQDVVRDFKGFLTKTIDEVVSNKRYLNIAWTTDPVNHVTKIVENNVNHERYPSSLVMLHAYMHLEKPEKSTNKKSQAFVLAVGLEMLQSHKAILENIEKENTTSDTKCAIEASVIQPLTFAILDNYFTGTIFRNLFDLYNKGFIYNAFGVNLNRASLKGKNKKYADFNMRQYYTICEYVTAYNKFKLPLHLAMQLANIDNETIHENVYKICFDLGKLYQMTEEYNDCFGEEQTNGISGSSIQSGKCTWLAVTALDHCSEPQRVVFNTCYGSKEPAHVERLKLLYQQLNIPQLFVEQKGALCESVTQRAEAIESYGIPSTLFFKLLELVVGNEKYI